MVNAALPFPYRDLNLGCRDHYPRLWRALSCRYETSSRPFETRLAQALRTSWWEIAYRLGHTSRVQSSIKDSRRCFVVRFLRRSSFLFCAPTRIHDARSLSSALCSQLSSTDCSHDPIPQKMMTIAVLAGFRSKQIKQNTDIAGDRDP